MFVDLIRARLLSVFPFNLPFSLMKFGGTVTRGQPVLLHFMRDSCGLLMLVTKNYFCMGENKCYFNKGDILLFIDTGKLFCSLV